MALIFILLLFVCAWFLSGAQTFAIIFKSLLLLNEKQRNTPTAVCFRLCACFFALASVGPHQRFKEIIVTLNLRESRGFYSRRRRSYIRQFIIHKLRVRVRARALALSSGMRNGRYAKLTSIVLSVLSSATRWLLLQSKGTFFSLRSMWSMRLVSLAHLSLIQI
jgi:hypothetical protein